MKGGEKTSFWIGATVGALVAAALLFSVYYVPRKGLAFGRDELRLHVVLAEAHGLHAGSPVLVSGVEAGEVRDVRIAELPAVGWRVVAGVTLFDGERFGAMLTTGSTYAVTRSGLLGEMVVAITPGGAGDRVSEGMLVDGQGPRDLDAMLADLAVVTQRLADFMDGRNAGDPSVKQALRDLQGTLRNLNDFSEKLPR